MKKLFSHLAIAASLFTSTYTVAMPSQPQVLIQQLLSGNVEFKSLMNRMSLEESGFTGVEVKAVSWTDGLHDLCQNYSRSGSVLRVKFYRNVNLDAYYYFSTKGGAEDTLQQCLNP